MRSWRRIPRSTVPRALVPLLVAALIVVGAAPAAPPDSPTSYIRASQLKALLEGGTRAEIIDVRKPEEYAEMHIAGARSIPVWRIASRAGSVSRTELVVLY